MLALPKSNATRYYRVRTDRVEFAGTSMGTPRFCLQFWE